MLNDTSLKNIIKASQSVTFCFNHQGRNSQNFVSNFGRFFVVTLGLKILRLLRLKVVFQTDDIKRWC